MTDRFGIVRCVGLLKWLIRGRRDYTYEMRTFDHGGYEYAELVRWDEVDPGLELVIAYRTGGGWFTTVRPEVRSYRLPCEKRRVTEEEVAMIMFGVR